MAKRSCDHCGLVYDDDVMIVDVISEETKYFCCKGCQGVFHLLRDEGLDSFYAKRGDHTLTPPTVMTEDTGRFDLGSFRQRYVTVRPDGLCEVSLIIEGIHCVACVWLNEKVLHRTDGITEVSINFTTNKARLVWDDEKIKLSGIIEKVRSIGYNAYPYDAAMSEERANKRRKEYYNRMIVAVFATMNIMWIAIAQYAGYFTGMDEGTKHILNIAEWILATPTLFYSGWVFYRGAWYGLRNGLVTMDLLVATGASLAYSYSIWATLTRQGEAYFDSVTMIITFVLVGKFLEVLAKKSAVDTMDRLTADLPTEVIVVRGDEKIGVGVEEVVVGEIIELRAGDQIAIDGVIVVGESSIDESSLTGESLPVLKRVGDPLLAGTLNLSHVVRYKTTKDFAHSTMSVIASLLEESLANKPHIEQLANRLSGYFSQTILTIALLTFGYWYGMEGSFEKALMIAISVIVIACPCALALATPVATLIGIGSASRQGILFKSSAYLETLAKATTLFVDKTGTLTQGRPQVVHCFSFSSFDQADVATLVGLSKHPVSQGVAAFLGESPLRSYEEVHEIEGEGLKAIIDGKIVLGGNRALMTRHGLMTSPYEGDNTLFYVAIDGVIVALYELSDPLKEGVKTSLEMIKTKGLKIIMLTGDHEATAKKIAYEAGIDTYYAAMTPFEKAAMIDEAHAKGEIVVMAGDGINDALALSKADIAIAMGHGAGVALDVSDVVLLKDRASDLARSLAISRRTYRFVKQNIALSILYNSLTIPLAVTGHVIPLVAALSMSLSSLIVVGNSMRIKQGENNG